MHDDAFDGLGGYQIVKKIGRGSFSNVFLATKDGEEYAIKVIPLSLICDRMLENIGAEISILKNIRDPHIIRLYRVQRSDQNLFLIMEYCSGGDLSNYIRKNSSLTEEASFAIIEEIILALQTLRSYNIMHRDLKPQNILISGLRSNGIPHIKLADFGLARYGEDMASTLCGSPFYMAPEILSSKNYDSRADLWSLGIIAYELFTGRVPIMAENHIELHRIYEKGWRPDLSLIKNERSKKLISSLLQIEPESRPDLYSLSIPSSDSGSAYFKEAKDILKWVKGDIKSYQKHVLELLRLSKVYPESAASVISCKCEFLLSKVFSADHFSNSKINESLSNLALKSLALAIENNDRSIDIRPLAMNLIAKCCNDGSVSEQSSSKALEILFQHVAQLVREGICYSLKEDVIGDLCLLEANALVPALLKILDVHCTAFSYLIQIKALFEIELREKMDSLVRFYCIK